MAACDDGDGWRSAEVFAGGFDTLLDSPIVAGNPHYPAHTGEAGFVTAAKDVYARG